ncbi:MAG: response regulator [Phycisphaerae bacterium]
MEDKRIILFVDDDQAALSAFKRAFIDEPYEILLASNAQQALELLALHKAAVIISDMMMPEVDGMKLLHQVKERYPYIIRILASGHANITNLLQAINESIIYRFITKPFKDDELKSIVSQAVDYYNLRVERDMLQAQVAQAKQQNQG